MSDDRLDNVNNIEDGVDRLIVTGVDVSDVCVVVTGNPKWILSKLGNYEFEEHRMSEGPSSASGTLVVGNYKIFLTSIFAQEDKLRAKALIFDKNAVRVRWAKMINGTLIENTNFYMQIQDPKADLEIKSYLLAEKPDWLKDYSEEDQNDMVGKFVVLRILEGIEVELVTPQNVLILNLPRTND